MCETSRVESKKLEQINLSMPLPNLLIYVTREFNIPRQKMVLLVPSNPYLLHFSTWNNLRSYGRVILDEIFKYFDLLRLVRNSKLGILMTWFSIPNRITYFIFSWYFTTLVLQLKSIWINTFFLLRTYYGSKVLWKLDAIFSSANPFVRVF